MVNHPQNGERSRSPEADEEFDLAAFQASLDNSVNAAKLLVDSWIPQDFGRGSTTVSSVQSLKERARPPRMGLGAQPAAIHKQQAEDRKLKERLLGKGRNGSYGDEGSTVKVVEPKSGGVAASNEGASESDSDDEDSRSRVISKGKGKGQAAADDPLSTTSKAVKNAPNNPFVISQGKKATTTSPSTTPRKSSTNGPPPLFNDPSPSKPVSSAPEPTATTSTSSTSTRTIAPVSFYSKTSDKSEATSALSKNQRKKLRKQEREQEHKNRLIGESRAEEEAERNKASKRARDEEGDDEDVAMEDADTEAVVAPSNTSTVEGTNGADPRKKKKKRRGKGKGGDSTLAQPLLNL